MAIDYKLIGQGITAPPDIATAFNNGVNIRGNLLNNQRLQQLLLSEQFTNQQAPALAEQKNLLNQADIQSKNANMMQSLAQANKAQSDMTNSTQTAQQKHYTDSVHTIGSGLMSITNPSQIPHYIDMYDRMANSPGGVDANAWKPIRDHLIQNPSSIDWAHTLGTATIDAKDQLAQQPDEPTDYEKAQDKIKNTQEWARINNAKIAKTTTSLPLTTDNNVNPGYEANIQHIISTGDPLTSGGRSKDAILYNSTLFGDATQRLGTDGATTIQRNGRLLKSADKQLDLLAKQQANLEPSEANLEKNIIRLKSIASDVNNSDYVPWNKFVNGWKTANGDTPMARYKSTINDVVHEAANLINGNGTKSGSTVSDNQLMEEAIPNATSYVNLVKILNDKISEASNRTGSIKDQIAKNQNIKDSINTYASGFMKNNSGLLNNANKPPSDSGEDKLIMNKDGSMNYGGIIITPKPKSK